MNRRIGWMGCWGAVLALSLAACGAREEAAPAATDLSVAERAARFPADLGASTVGADAYPQNIQDGYRLFLAACSECHAPARALYSRMTSREDWRRYIERMHTKHDRRGILPDGVNKAKVMDFLVYDSKVRKIDGKETFLAQLGTLEKMFAQLEQDRSRLIDEETRGLPKKETPYTGAP